MKRKVLLLSLSAGMSVLVLSSYQTGPFQGGAGNHTGSAGSVSNCSTGSGCHSTNNTNTQATISLTTLAGAVVNTYTPGTIYKVVISGSSTTSFPKFGFQASCVKTTATSTQAGAFTSTSGNISIRTFGSPQFQLVEHNSPLASTGGTSFQATFNWTAPAAGTGSVSFYGTLNAVNGNAASTGDQPNSATTLSVPESPSGINSVALLHLSIYPNPATNALHIKLEGAGHTCYLNITDISGRLVTSQETSISNGEAVAEIANLKSGNYYLIVSQGSKHYLAPFVKY